MTCTVLAERVFLNEALVCFRSGAFLAARAELNRNYVADIELGERNLSLGTIHKLTAALGVSIIITKGGRVYFTTE